jgi:twitching motility protein PilT
MDNQLAAQLLYQHGYATQDQIMAVWSNLGADGNLPDLLCQKGAISENTRDQLMTYLLSVASPPASPEDSAAPAIASPPESDSSLGEPFDSGGAWLAAPPPEDIPPLPVESPADFVAEKKPASRSDDAPAPLAKAPSPTRPEAGPFTDWVRRAREQAASDLHLCAGMPAHWRLHGRLESVGTKPLGPEECEQAAREALGQEAWEDFQKRGDLETVVEWPDLGRVRVTALRERKGIDLTARLLPQRILSFEELGLPESCRDLTRWSQGLVLVTGPAGCGKSTTLSALVDMVNQSRREHILTIEDPIEVLFEPAGCQITQRQVRKHTADRNTALRAALREDPDILVISELRDLESIQLAVSAAETGHLVFGAMNTNNATRTIYRLIDSFPPEEQGIIRNMVSESLRGIISQQLLPLRDGSGVIPAFEVLTVNSAVANMIRKDETHQLGTAMITGKSAGMVLLDDSLRTLVEQGRVDPVEAWKRAVQPKDFERYMPRGR